MTEKKNFRPTDWREARCLQAWELKQKGWKQKAIAEALSVIPGAVIRWFKRAQQGGVEGLRRWITPGAQPRLSLKQLRKLPDWLTSSFWQAKQPTV